MVKKLKIFAPLVILISYGIFMQSCGQDKPKVMMVKKDSTGHIVVHSDPKDARINQLEDSVKNAFALLHENHIEYKHVYSVDTTKAPDAFVAGGRIENRIKFIIYHKQRASQKNIDAGYGKWEYWITDASDYNWGLLSDEDYQVNQVLILNVAK